MTSLTDKHVYIVGPLKAQNELMASFLKLETGATCMAVMNFRDLQVTDKGTSRHPNLTLWDCFGRDREGCLSELDTEARSVLSQDYVALFNLIPWSGIEEEAVARGARGFFYLEEPLEQFKQGVQAIFNGELWAPRKIMSECIIKDSKPDHIPENTRIYLTNRERQILQMVEGGWSNVKIAKKLCISSHTVKTHLYNIYKKIKVPSRLQAALWAAKNL